MNTLEQTNTDFRQRFVFDELDVRGCIVQLTQTCEAIQATHHYPENLAKVLNQFALAAALLRDSIKIDGSLTIQLRTQGAIKLIMADCMSDRRIRAIAEYEQEELAPNDAILLDQLDNSAVLAITISPDDGERYQSIVPIENATLAQCLADYFDRSEQLPSSFAFYANKDKAFGLSLHALPAQKVTNKADSDAHFERLNMLLKTLTEEEALSLSSTDVLTRLFHEESCRLFDAHDVEFGCVCSVSKSLDAIKSLGQEEVTSLIAEQQEQGNANLVVDCHFCFQRYEFEFDDLEKIFQGDAE